MDITTTKILLKYEEKINKFLKEKEKENNIVYNIPNINSNFYKIIKYPSIDLEIYNGYQKESYFRVQCKSRMKEIIEEYSKYKKYTNYVAKYNDIETEPWYVFAVLTKKTYEKLKSVYFLKENSSGITIQGISLDNFIKDLTLPFSHKMKKYFTEQNINDFKELINQ